MYSFTVAQGIIRGKITDSNGESVIGAAVVLKSNRAIGSITDLDGNYSLKVPDSLTQTLVISSVGFKSVEETVRVTKGEVVIKNFSLVSSAQEIGQVEITAKAEKAKTYYMEKVKMNSSTTIDYVSSESMKKTGDANVVAAVTRVTGVSTNSGGFITVRGIGDRYVKTSINGSRIPTLDPYTNNIKLDIFPSSLVDNILITKSASPDLPGDWAGAYLSVETKDYPEELSINVESSFGYNNQSTFKDVLTSQRSKTDWLGYDNNLRDHDHDDFTSANMSPTRYQEFVALGLGDYYNSIGVTENTEWDETLYKLGLVELGLLPKALFDNPDAVANAKYLYQTGSYTADAFAIINAGAAESGRSFPNNWNTFYRKAPVNFSQSLSIGNQTQLFGKPLGFIAGVRYGSSINYDPVASAHRVAIDDSNRVSIPSSAIEQSSKENNGWSALLNAAYKLNSHHSVSLLFMPNFSGVNSVNFSNADLGKPDLVLTKSQFYEQRRQLVYQFKSEHYIPKSKIKMELNASYTKGKSSAPDFKRLTYRKNKEAEIYAIGGGEEGGAINRFYRYLSEDIFDSRLSAEIPVWEKPGLARKIKLGGAYQDNQRESDQYDYYVTFGPRANTLLENGDIDEFFSLDNFGISSGYFNGIPYSSLDIYYGETGNPANHTIGYSKVKAGFMMVDYTIIPSVRFAGGLRVEHADIFTDAFKYDSLGLTADDPRRQFPGEIFTLRPGKLDEVSYLPSASLIYKIKQDDDTPINVRLNYSQSVARPSIRELSDVVVYDYEYKALIYGNSDLKMVRAKNYDLRFEAYFKSNDNVSVSVFYKDFRDHIEISDAPQGYTWINVDKSWVRGIEIEGRKAIFNNLEFRANITLVESRTEFIQEALLITNGIKTYTPIGPVSRTMFGQAPYVLNGILNYKLDSLGLSLTLGYNVQGPRLVISSFNKFLNVYELPRHLLDFKVSKKLGKYLAVSVTVKDILNTPVRRSFDFDEGFIVDYDKYTYGTNYILGVSYNL